MKRGLHVILAALLAAAACVHRSPEPAAETTPSAPPPPATPAVVDIPHRAGTPVAVLRTQSVGAPLLSPELDRLTQWAARHLALQPQVALDPLPLGDVEDAAALAKEHRFVKDGPQCGAGPSAAEVAVRLWPDAAIARSWADCSTSPCRFIVEATRPGANGDPQRIGLWTATVADPALMPQWEAAAQQLAADNSSQAPALPPLNAEVIAASPPVRVASVEGKGAWSSPPTVEAFAAAVPALQRCHAKGRLAHGRDSLVLAYDAEGAATYCEGASRTPQSDELLSCFCDAAKQARQPAGEEGRRAVVRLEDPVDLSATASDGTPITTRIEAFVSTAPKITEESLLPAKPWLALCYATTRLRDEISFPVKFAIDATGHVTTAEISGIARTHALGPCVEGYLRFMTFPCTPAGGTIAFTVRIGRGAGSDVGVSQNVPTTAAPFPVGTSRADTPAGITPSTPSMRGCSSSGTPTPNALPISVPVKTSVR